MKPSLLICIAFLGFGTALVFGRAISGLDVHKLAVRESGHEIHEHYVFRIGCWVEESVAFENKSADGSAIEIAHPLADFVSMLNFIVGQTPKTYVSDRFIMASTFGSSLETGIISINELMSKPSARSIIYLNYPSAFTAFSTWDHLDGALRNLDEIELEYPKAKVHARTLRRLILNSAGYRFLERKKQLTSIAAPLNPLINEIPYASNFQSWAHLRDQVLTQVRLTFTAPLETLNLLHLAVKNYAQGPDLPFRLPPTPDQYFSHAGGSPEAWIAFWSMAAEMSEQKGIPFVYYITPMLNLTAEEYARNYRPRFIDQLKKIEQSHSSFIVADHAIDHDLKINEMSSMKNARGYEFKTGYLTTIIGQYKRSLILLEELESRGIVSAKIQPRPNWRWMAHLPEQSFAARLMPESLRAMALEENYQPVFESLSQPLSLAGGNKQ